MTALRGGVKKNWEKAVMLAALGRGGSAKKQKFADFGQWAPQKVKQALTRFSLSREKFEKFDTEESSNREFNIIYSRWFEIDQGNPKKRIVAIFRPEV